MKNLIKLGFVLIILIAFAHLVIAEEDKPIKQPQKVSSEKSSKTSWEKFLGTAPQKNQPPPAANPESILKEVDRRIRKSNDDVLKETDRRIDRAIGIIGFIAKVIGTFMAGLAIIIAIGIAIGVYQLREWRRIRKEAEKTLDEAKKEASEIEEIKQRMEKHVNKAREQTKDLSLLEKPSDEDKRQLDELSHRLDSLELFGIPLKSEDYASRGRHFFYKKEYELALKCLEKAIEIDPNSAMAWSNKSLTLGKLNRHDDALIAVEKAIKIDPNFVMAWSNKSSALSKLNRYDDALIAVEKAIEIDPNYLMAWSNMSAILIDLDRYDDALIAVEKAIKIDPNSAMAWSNKSSALGKLNRHDDALITAEKAIEIDSNFVMAWLNKSASLNKLNRHDDALSAN